jgi:hypothetical protein
MFWAFKLGFDVAILALWPFPPKIGRNSGHTGRDRHSNLLDPLVRYEQIDVLWIRPLGPFYKTFYGSILPYHNKLECFQMPVTCTQFCGQGWELNSRAEYHKGLHSGKLQPYLQILE